VSKIKSSLKKILEKVPKKTKLKVVLKASMGSYGRVDDTGAFFFDILVPKQYGIYIPTSRMLTSSRPALSGPSGKGIACLTGRAY